MEFSTTFIPMLPSLGFSDEEKRLIALLEARWMRWRAPMELTEAYYLGEQVIDNLRIAVPKELESLRTIVGWPAMAVDPYVERLSADSFMLSDATDGDQYLADIMDANDFASEQGLAFTDALSMGRSYWSVGSPEEKGGPPQITVESPLNMSVLWDLRGTTPRAAMYNYWSEGARHGALVLPRQTIHLGTDDNGQWVIVNRDQHGFDFVPVVRMAHKPRTHNRDGISAITPAMMSLTDAACRTLLGLEVAREIYSVPQKTILGAAEDAFIKSDGSTASAWETYITKTLGLERDENGDLPSIHQAQVYDPSVFTKLLDWYASSMSGLVAATPQQMGLYTQGNPASAESVVALNAERDLRAMRMQRQFGTPLKQVAKYAAMFDNKGVLPDKYKNMDIDWLPVAIATPGVTSDAISKQVSVGAIPPTSDVTLKKLNYNARERARLAVDREADGAQSLLAEIASNLQVKQARSDLIAIKDAAPVTAEPVAPAAPSGNA